MKIAILIFRSLLGILLLFASASYFLKLFPEPEVAGNLKVFNDGIAASLYLLPLVKAIELICGLSYLSGKYVTLTNLVLLPVSFNILCINLFLAPEGLPIALFLFLGNVFLIGFHWKKYQSLFSPNL
ncbi:DoxX family protein [Flavobacterium sp. SOK18b]|uniref:DoxX family protein n=1 Tax=Flavobacterium sp. SOK18b TaxID=797900 RepID=UPI0015FB893F|nr:DoxX family protein [Flavobacterium sp. SOK18b]MBB1193889.1 DoxX family protein [Flavobacterium sp. SOK18b]